MFDFRLHVHAGHAITPYLTCRKVQSLATPAKMSFSLALASLEVVLPCIMDYKQAVCQQAWQETLYSYL